MFNRLFYFSLFVLLFFCFCQHSYAEDVVIFGPRTFVVDKSKSVNETVSFPSSMTGPGFTLRIKNGDDNGRKLVTSGTITLNGTVVVTPSDLNNQTGVIEKIVPLNASNDMVVDLGGKNGTFINITILYAAPVPTVSVSADPSSISVGETSTLSWNSTNADTISIDQGIGPVSASGSTMVSPITTTTYTITATGPEGTATDSVTVTVGSDPAPTVNISAAPDTIQPGESSTLSWSSTDADTCEIAPDIGAVATNDSVTIAPAQTTTYTITATGPGGNATDQAVVTVSSNRSLPDGSFINQYGDLIPADASVEFDANRFAIITGLVQDTNDVPIMDVSVTIHNHSEYGTAYTDSEGRFAIPVNGGGKITLVYQKQGLITVHRKVDSSWNDFSIAKTITMIALDTVSTMVNFDGNPSSTFTHRSSQITDEHGTRSVTMIFTGDNLAHEVDAAGNIIGDLNSLTTRATEFSTQKSMPAVLPANSAFTYCAELSVDGAQRVQFDKPVITWVDNFLGFNVGDVVPVGYYDRDKGAWIASENGIVVKLLDTDTNGIVDALDSDGDDLPNDLDGDSSFNDEVTGLDDPGIYQPGTTFWRVAISHFTPWDCNWPYGPPSDAVRPNPEEKPVQDEQKPDEKTCNEETGSFTEHRSRVFHEDIPVPGTDMTLHYASNRVEDYKTVISIPASGATIPASLESIIVEMSMAGKKYTSGLDPLPDQKVEFIWDGLNFMGDPVSGTIYAKIKIGFKYPAYYMTPGELAQAFSQLGTGASTSIRARQEIILWNESVMEINRPYSAIAKGWGISSQHASQAQKFTLYKGDGTTLKHGMAIIDRFAGTDGSGYSGDGGPALEAELDMYMELTSDPAGNIYLADASNNCIRKIDTQGIITTIAGGNKKNAYAGDGGPATRAKLNRPSDIECDDEGNLYFISKNYVIRKIDTQGIITTVAGNGVHGYSGDGGPATEASLDAPSGLALDSAGNIYTIDFVSDSYDRYYRIRKIDTNGIINTIHDYYSGNYSFTYIFGSDLVVDDSGSIYFADYPKNQVRKITQDGESTVFAGNGGLREVSVGDYSPATQAPIGEIIDITLDPDDNLYISCCDFWMGGYGGLIKKVDQHGIITTISGTETKVIDGDGGLASEAEMELPDSITFDPSGNLYISDREFIRKISYAASNFFCDNEGYGYLMSDGRHEKTIDLETGIFLLEFGYTTENELESITDRFGNSTTIQRDVTGIPTEIISPDGIITGLTIDSNNHLTRITHPDGGYYDFEYTPGGLLTAKIEPESNRFDHIFDTNGRLTDALNEEGGHWQFARTESANNNITSTILTGEGNLTTYVDHTDFSGNYLSVITGPNGEVTTYSSSSDGLSADKFLSCGMDLSFTYDIDPEHKFKFVKEMTETTQLGLIRTTARNHTYEDTDLDTTPDLITKTVTVNGKTTILENNVLQSKKTITTPEGRTVTIAYNPATLVTESVSIPDFFDTSYGYDSKGRVISVDTDTRGIDYTYNAQGFLKTFTDAENRTTSYLYDEVGRVTQISRPDTTSLWFSYDANGNMTVLTNPSIIDHGFGFNKVNLNSSYTTPLSGSYTYAYDKDRRLTSKIFPSLESINYIYDNARLSQIQAPEGNIDYTYYCGTKIDSITGGSESLTYGYDGKLVTSETLAGTLNQNLSYTWNNDFNLTGFTYAGSTAIYAYDNDNLLTGSGSFTIARNAQNGLPESVTGGSLNLARTFNGHGEADILSYTINSQNLTTWDLTRDNNGRITHKSETVNGTPSEYDYTYDFMGKLLTVTKDSSLVEEYQYSANGTRIYEMNTARGIAGRTLSYSDGDHLLTAGTTTYQYNVNGFLESKTNGTDVTDYMYSSRGELLSVTLPDSTLIDYMHDPIGRRIAKKVNSTITEKYLWRGLTRLLAIYDGSDNLAMRFEYADGRMPVALTTGGNTYYLTFDQVGSLKLVADSSGNVVKQIEYDTFGNILTDTNPVFEIPFGFSGGLHDRHTGLVRFGYRDYDPETGRWTAKDPIFFAGGDTDLYGYVLNDPVNFVDPMGLFDVGPTGAVGGAITGAVAGAITGGITGGWSGIISGAVSGTVAGTIGGALTGTVGGAIAGAMSGIAGEMLSPSDLTPSERDPHELIFPMPHRPPEIIYYPIPPQPIDQNKPC